MSIKAKRIIKEAISAFIAVITILTAFCSLILITFNFTYTKTRVKQHSMLPTINSTLEDPNIDGDTILINKYRSSKRGDVVVAKVPWWNGYVVKRLVAVGGDRLMIKEVSNEYQLIVNDEIMYTVEINTNTTNYYETGYLLYVGPSAIIDRNENHVFLNSSNEKYIQLLDDEVFLIGDNWEKSTDGTKYGPDKDNCLVGVVDIILPYKGNHFISFWSQAFKILFG